MVPRVRNVRIELTDEEFEELGRVAAELGMSRKALVEVLVRALLRNRDLLKLAIESVLSNT